MPYVYILCVRVRTPTNDVHIKKALYINEKRTEPSSPVLLFCVYLSPSMSVGSVLGLFAKLAKPLRILLINVWSGVVS